MTIRIVAVSDAVYANETQSAIDCVLDTMEMDTIPYTVTDNDPTPWGQELWIELLGGTHGAIAPYDAPVLLPAQQAAVAMAAGIILTSTGTPALDGQYSLSATAQSNVNATVTYILLNGTFPGGGDTMPWVDQTGSAHLWPSVDVFKLFATVFADYVAAVSLYALSNGQDGSLPSNAITIS